MLTNVHLRALDLTHFLEQLIPIIENPLTLSTIKFYYKY